MQSHQLNLQMILFLQMQSLVTRMIRFKLVVFTFSRNLLVGVEPFRIPLDDTNVWELDEHEKMQLVYVLQSLYVEKASSVFLAVSQAHVQVKTANLIVVKVTLPSESLSTPYHKRFIYPCIISQIMIAQNIPCLGYILFQFGSCIVTYYISHFSLNLSLVGHFY